MIFPDRFVNGDQTNDLLFNEKESFEFGGKNGRHGGDIQGIINEGDILKRKITLDLNNPVKTINRMEEKDLSQPNPSKNSHLHTNFLIVLDRNNNSIKQFPKNTRLAIFRYIYEILTKNESISYLDIFNKIEKNLKRIDGIPKSELLELKKKFNDLKYRETLRQYFQEMAKVIVKLRELDANYSKIEIQEIVRELISGNLTLGLSQFYLKV